jgi:hypothetical protein
MVSEAFRPVIAPKIIFIERFEIFPNRDHRGAGGVHCERVRLIAGDMRLLHRLAGSTCQSAYLIVVRLRGILGVFAFAVERVFCKCGSE